MIQRKPRFLSEAWDEAELASVNVAAKLSGPEIAHGFRLYLLDEQARLRASLAPISTRDGSKYYEAEALLKDYLALRQWFAKQR